jgi:hypothetical protein
MGSDFVSPMVIHIEGFQPSFVANLRFAMICATCPDAAVGVYASLRRDLNDFNNLHDLHDLHDLQDLQDLQNLYYQ